LKRHIFAGGWGVDVFCNQELPVTVQLRHCDRRTESAWHHQRSGRIVVVGKYCQRQTVVACTLTPPPVNSATPRNAVLRLITSSLETFDFMINIVQAPVITSISPAAASRISPTTFEVIISNMPASPAPLFLFKGNLFSGENQQLVN